MLSHLPKALRILRRRLGLSQAAAAKTIRTVTGSRLTSAMLCDWERGRKRPSLSSLESFLEGLNLNVLDLHTAIEEARREEASQVAELPEDETVH